MKKGTLNEKFTTENAEPADIFAFCILHFAFRLRSSAAW